jgi:hypothetical protein
LLFSRKILNPTNDYAAICKFRDCLLNIIDDAEDYYSFLFTIAGGDHSERWVRQERLKRASEASRKGDAAVPEGSRR